MANTKPLQGPMTLREMYPVVNENVTNLNEDIGTVKADVTSHKTSTQAHGAEHITYTGGVVGATTVKQAIDDVKGELNTIVASAGDGTKDTEIVLARKDAATLGDRLDGVDTQLAETGQQVDQLTVVKADKTEVNALATAKANQIDLLATNNNVTSLQSQVDGIDRGYGGTYASLAALQAAVPLGDDKRYVTSDNGHWYYWNGSSWVDGGVFQATGLGDRTVEEVKTTFFDSFMSKNKFDSANANIITNQLPGSGFVAGGTGVYSFLLACNPNTSYTITKQSNSSEFTAAFVETNTLVNGTTPVYNRVVATAQKRITLEGHSLGNYILCVFWRVSVDGAYTDAAMKGLQIMVEEGIEPHDYEPYGSVYKMGMEKTHGIEEYIDETVLSVEKVSRNIFNVKTPILRLNQVPGNGLVANSVGSYSLLIPCESNKSYVITKQNSSSEWTAAFTNTATLVSGTTPIYNRVVATGEDVIYIGGHASAQYILLQFWRTSVDGTYTEEQLINLQIMVEEGSTKHDYEPYGLVRKIPASKIEGLEGVIPSEESEKHFLDTSTNLVPKSAIQRTLISNFYSSDGWTFTSPNVTYVTDLVKHGVESLRIGASPTVPASADLTVSLDLSKKSLGFWFYVENRNNLSNFTLYMHSGSWDGYLQYDVGSLARVTADGWNYITVTPADLVKVGTEQVRIDRIKLIRFRVNANANGNTSVTFDKLEYAPIVSTKPKIGFRFDDGMISVYNKVKPILDKYGMVATAAIIPSLVGSSSYYMSENQIKHLKEIGWCISSHTINHLNLREVGINEAIYELVESQKWLARRGLGARTFCYPYGGFTPQVLEEVRKVYDVASCSRYQYMPTGLVDRAMLPCAFYINTTTPVSEVKKKIDLAVENNQTLFLGFHGIDTPTGGLIEYSPAEFEEIAAYVASKDIDVITLDDVADEYKDAQANQLTGEILIDTVTKQRYILKVTDGVLGVELAP